jgi:CIC family chloride channel protein
MSQPRPDLRARVRGIWESPRTLFPALFAETAPIDLSIVGRTVWRAALVGLAAGLVGAAFFAAVEYSQRFLLEDLAGYVPLRARGETFAAPAAGSEPAGFRPWLLFLLPALGGLLCGLITRLAVETRGGGVEAMMDAFHRRGGAVRRRVIWIKSIASVCTLGTGGAGGREGPTMQVGAALGSTVGRILHVSVRERRILLVAGVAAGTAAVFRTPLGAAILAVEILYKDGFESDALVPSVLASVIAYSIVISIFGESTLFDTSARYPFEPTQLWLFALMTLVVSAGAIAFLVVYRAVGRVVVKLPGPDWMRPALGGAALGALATPIVLFVGSQVGGAGQGLGILGGGYGSAQMAITGVEWLPGGWNGAGLLLLLACAKLLAVSFTIGSGGSAGLFAPSLAIGALLGSAFGRAAQLLLDNPSIDPGAFALVGMGVFFGGIVHVPLASLVLVCEMAGNYDLLVPLMLSLGIAFVALRKHNLHEGQVASVRESPAHRDALVLETLKATRAADLVARGRPYASFSPGTPAAEMLRQVGESTWQDVFPVVEPDGTLRGLAGERGEMPWAVAADVMQPPVTVGPEDDLRRVTERLVDSGLREIPVVDPAGRILGFLDEADLTRVHLEAARRAEQAGRERAATDPGAGAG